MKDLTLLYYTANLVEEPFGENVRKHLLSIFPEGVPIISISHKPMDFGENICVAGFEVSIYNIYKQILMGAKAAKTQYVACCEDDALYTREHFSYRVKDCFAYNCNKWMVNQDIFFHRNRVNMSMCIAPTELMISTLEDRFKKYPNVLTREEMGITGFGEPGKFEARMGLPIVKMETFMVDPPTLTFNHRPSVGGVRKVLHKDTMMKELKYWGPATLLWERMYNGRI